MAIATAHITASSTCGAAHPYTAARLQAGPSLKAATGWRRVLRLGLARAGFGNAGLAAALLLAALLMASTPAWAQRAPASAPATSAAVEQKARVVYHADFSDPRRFSSMLTSINFMVTHYTNEMIDFDVRVVFNSHGIRFLTDDPLTGTPFAADAALLQQRDNLRGRLLALHQVHRVKLELCEITRAQVNLDASKLYRGVELVPSGVVRLAELQNQMGFAYIKVE